MRKDILGIGLLCLSLGIPIRGLIGDIIFGLGIILTIYGPIAKK